VPVAVPGQHDVYDYLGSAGGPIELPRLGITVRNGSATLNNGQRVFGALVAEVSSTGAAAKALNSHHPSRIILEGALFGMAVASAVFFPPAAVGVTTIACYVADSYDLVIAVDGHRVKNTLDLAELVEDEQSGDMVYLVILRKGQRFHVAIPIR
jgi:S1-C subfamily serine protease